MPNQWPKYLLATFIVSHATFVSAQYKIDTRQSVTLTKEEKAWLMNEMRGHFSAVQAIIAGSGSGDYGSARLAAADRGLAHLNEPTRLKFPQKTSDTWKAFASGMHQGFDRVANMLDQNAPKEQLLLEVSAVMQNCMGCHATYRIVEDQ